MGFINVLFAVSYFIIFIYLLYFVIDTGQVMYYAKQLFKSEEDQVATYQGFSRSALIILIFLIAVYPNFAFRVAIIVSGIFVLFVLGSRSELYAFLALSTVLSIILWSKNIKYSILILLAFLMIIFFIEHYFEILMSSRQLQTLDLSSSTSWILRQHVQEIAIGQIMANPLFGIFGGHVMEGGSIGAYAHNVLSAWVNYGFLGFLMYMSLSLISFFVSAHFVVIKRNMLPHWILAFSVNFVCLLLILIAKSIFWLLPALGWGFFVNALINSRGFSVRSAVIKSQRLLLE